jgi:hypothetical protein
MDKEVLLLSKEISSATSSGANPTEDLRRREPDFSPLKAHTRVRRLGGGRTDGVERRNGRDTTIPGVSKFTRAPQEPETLRPFIAGAAQWDDKSREKGPRIPQRNRPDTSRLPRRNNPESESGKGAGRRRRTTEGGGAGAVGTAGTARGRGGHWRIASLVSGTCARLAYRSTQTPANLIALANSRPCHRPRRCAKNRRWWWRRWRRWSDAFPPPPSPLSPLLVCPRYLNRSPLLMYKAI